jgi:hypothetical protein
MESTNGIPDVVGLEAMVSATQDKSPVAPPPPEQQAQTRNEKPTEQQAPPTEQPNLAQFKTPEALLAGYKELQGTFTRTAQENATLKQNMEALKAQFDEQMELIRLSQMQPQYQQQQAPAKNFDQMFLENPEKAIESLAETKAQKMLLQSKIQDVLEEESLRTPQEFNERYAYAKMVSQRFPQLVTSSAGVRKLFQMGDKLREEQQKTQAYNAVTKMFGDNVDMEKFKKLISRDSNVPPTNNQNLAYMPDTNTSTRSGSEIGSPQGYDTAIKQAASKGDVDSVLNGLFQQKGLK